MLRFHHIDRSNGRDIVAVPYIYFHRDLERLVAADLGVEEHDWGDRDCSAPDAVAIENIGEMPVLFLDQPGVSAECITVLSDGQEVPCIAYFWRPSEGNPLGYTKGLVCIDGDDWGLADARDKCERNVARF